MLDQFSIQQLRSAKSQLDALHTDPVLMEMVEDWDWVLDYQEGLETEINLRKQKLSGNKEVTLETLAYNIENDQEFVQELLLWLRKEEILEHEFLNQMADTIQGVGQYFHQKYQKWFSRKEPRDLTPGQLAATQKILLREKNLLDEIIMRKKGKKTPSKDLLKEINRLMINGDIQGAMALAAGISE